MVSIRTRSEHSASPPAGTSAGLATRYGAKVYDAIDAADRLSARPAIAAPIYAVQSMTLPLAHGGSRDMLLGSNPSPQLERAHSPAHNITATTPPCFLAHAEDDMVVSVENSLQMRAALKVAGVNVETHLFTVGGHGFSRSDRAGEPARRWKELFVTWARSQGLG